MRGLKCMLFAAALLQLLVWLIIVISNGLSEQTLITDEERELLRRNLASLAFRNKTVILTLLNRAWTNDEGMFDMFLQSFKLGIGTKKLLDHLLAITVDQESYQRCLLVHGHCYMTLKLDASRGSKGSMKFKTPHYVESMWRRVDLLREVLELGYSFVYTDADIMWFRDPFPHFHPEADLEGAPDARDILNNGFIHAVSNERTVELYKMWYRSRLKRSGHEQAMFNDYLRFTPEFQRIAPNVKFLNSTRFTGFCMLNLELEEVCTIHANCCTHLERKLADLGLVLDDWKAYLAAPDGDRTKRKTSRAPSHCLHSWCDDLLDIHKLTDLQKTYHYHWCRYIKAKLRF